MTNGITRLERMWMNPHWHVGGLGTFMLGLFLVYVAAHHTLNRAYFESVSGQIENSTKLYQIVEDPNSNELVLMFAGERFPETGPVVAGPLGIGKLASVRGYLASVHQRVNDYNRVVADSLEATFAAFEPVPGTNGYRAKLRAFSPNANPDWFIYVDGTDPKRLAANQKGLRQLKALTRTLDCKDRTQRESASANGSVSGMIEPPSKASDNVKAATARVAGKVVEAEEFKLAWARVGVDDCRKHVDAFFDQLDEQLRFLYTSLAGGDEDSSSETPGWRAGFHTTLTDLVHSEIGYFWLHGLWRGIEVILLTWLGVMTECLVRLGLTYAGRKTEKAQKWEPRETGRTFLKLAYAPIVSIVVIWTLYSTDVIQSDIANTTSAALVVTLAFVFGLFPNMAYSLLERLAKAIFKATSFAGPAMAESRRVSARNTPPTPKGHPPDFAAVRKAAEDHATAIFRRGG